MVIGTPARVYARRVDRPGALVPADTALHANCTQVHYVRTYVLNASGYSTLAAVRALLLRGKADTRIPDAHTLAETLCIRVARLYSGHYLLESRRTSN